MNILKTLESNADQDIPETRQALLTGERAEFFAHDRHYVDTIFDDGESPLKHAHAIELESSEVELVQMEVSAVVLLGYFGEGLHVVRDGTRRRVVYKQHSRRGLHI